MVFGFPGRTEQYLTSDAVEHVIERLNPMRISMRDEGLAVINAPVRRAMRCALPMRPSRAVWRMPGRSGKAKTEASPSFTPWTKSATSKRS